EYSNSNYSYFPVLIEPEFRVSRDELYLELKRNDILSRRYFYPLISNMPMYRGIESAAVENLPLSNAISDKVLCLPIFNELSKEDFSRIINVIRG
ncbi:DegT/DnrJ/EryC1/StrS family aminotransferase, partial [Salmonella enterica]|nr:DegT/DnrJ/EryC1/StrS family aminotransferase [Salmonella enterica]